MNEPNSETIQVDDGCLVPACMIINDNDTENYYIHDGLLMLKFLSKLVNLYKILIWNKIICSLLSSAQLIIRGDIHDF